MNLLSPDLMNTHWFVEDQINHVNGDEFRIRQLYKKERLQFQTMVERTWT